MKDTEKWLSYLSAVHFQAVEGLQNYSFPPVNIILFTSTQRLGLTDEFLEKRNKPTHVNWKQHGNCELSIFTFNYKYNTHNCELNCCCKIRYWILEINTFTVPVTLLVSFLYVSRHTVHCKHLIEMSHLWSCFFSLHVVHCYCQSSWSPKTQENEWDWQTCFSSQHIWLWNQHMMLSEILRLHPHHSGSSDFLVKLDSSDLLFQSGFFSSEWKPVTLSDAHAQRHVHARTHTQTHSWAEAGTRNNCISSQICLKMRAHTHTHTHTN